MFADHPDFHDGEAAIERYTLALIIDATQSQIAFITTLFDILGDPSYNPENSEHQVELGRTCRWFSAEGWSCFLHRACAIMGTASAFSLTLSAHLCCNPANSSSNAADSGIDDVTPGVTPAI